MTPALHRTLAAARQDELMRAAGCCAPGRQDAEPLRRGRLALRAPRRMGRREERRSKTCGCVDGA